MLKVWGRTNSVNVQKVMWTVAELGLAHEHVDAGGQFGLVGEDWFLAMNPNGRVPVIDDDGFALWESNTIVRYLCAKYGVDTLCPVSVEARADAEKWMDWQLATLLAPITQVFWQLIRTPADQRDMAAVDAATEQCSQALAIIDRHLAENDYLVGRGFSMGDIPLGAMTHRWYAMDLPHPDLPNLWDWYQRLAERPAYQVHVMLPLS